MTADVVAIRKPIAAKFRPADTVDEELFYRWRRDQERDGRKGGWYEGRPVTRAAHRVWFRDRLGKLEILVWERAGLPLGYVRLDSDGSLAFHPHSPVAVPMLAACWALADRYGGRLKATVDLKNRGAVEALEAAGFGAVPASFHVYRAVR